VGRPILYIGEPRSEAADLVRDHELGFVIQERDVPSVVVAIRNLRADPVLQGEICARARALFEARYDAGIVIDLFESLLKESHRVRNSYILPRNVRMPEDVLATVGAEPAVSHLSEVPQLSDVVRGEHGMAGDIEARH
jgi:hypothetical protein